MTASRPRSALLRHAGVSFFIGVPMIYLCRYCESSHGQWTHTCPCSTNRGPFFIFHFPGHARLIDPARKKGAAPPASPARITLTISFLAKSTVSVEAAAAAFQ